jgi:hypothetical protein
MSHLVSNVLISNQKEYYVPVKTQMRMCRRIWEYGKNNSAYPTDNHLMSKV